MGFENAGAKCIYSCEWNKYARITYNANFPTELERFPTDITKVDEYDIPKHNILVAGFPCQPFSLAGLKKGFSDPTQGTLFYDILRILRATQPEAVLLENVPNLQSHDKGNTFKIIITELEKLGYHTSYQIISSQDVVPQKRRRIYIAGFLQKTEMSWATNKLPITPTLKDILHPEDGSEAPEPPYTNKNGKVDKKYILTPKTWASLKRHASRHKAAGNGFGYARFTGADVARTISARYYKDGSEALIARGQGRPRKLTPRECARLMGFPETFKITVSDVQAYHQFGNSVVVPIVSDIAKNIVVALEQQKNSDSEA